MDAYNPPCVVMMVDTVPEASPPREVFELDTTECSIGEVTASSLESYADNNDNDKSRCSDKTPQQDPQPIGAASVATAGLCGMLLLGGCPLWAFFCLGLGTGSANESDTETPIQKTTARTIWALETEQMEASKLHQA